MSDLPALVGPSRGIGEAPKWPGFYIDITADLGAPVATPAHRGSESRSLGGITVCYGNTSQRAPASAYTPDHLRALSNTDQ